MDRSTEELVNKIVAEVLAELSRRGVKAELGLPRKNRPATGSPPSENVLVVDMSDLRSPILLERHLLTLAPEIREIAVPAGTAISPGARDIVRKKNLILKSIPKTN